jgi:hypothetical protein
MMPTGDNSSRPWDLGANAADGMMSHHFHLVVEPPHPTVLAGMKWLLGTYTGRFNRWHQQPGHLFRAIQAADYGGERQRTVEPANPTGTVFGEAAATERNSDDGGLDREAITDGECGQREYIVVRLVAKN